MNPCSKLLNDFVSFKSIVNPTLFDLTILIAQIPIDNKSMNNPILEKKIPSQQDDLHLQGPPPSSIQYCELILTSLIVQRGF